MSETKSVLTTWKVPSPRKNVVLFLVPVPILAIGTVPDAIAEPFKLVIFEPLIAAAVPESCAAGKLVKDAPEPLNVVAVATPAFPK